MNIFSIFKKRPKPVVINIATDYSKTPGGYHDGFNFKSELLVPALNSGNNVTVQMDGTRGYASSFLEGAFSSLKWLYPDIEQKLKIESKDSSLHLEISEYL